MLPGIAGQLWSQIESGYAIASHSLFSTLNLTVRRRFEIAQHSAGAACSCLH